MHPNRRLARRLKRHTTESPEVIRPIPPRYSVRADRHEPTPTEATAYRQDWGGDTLTFNCGYCGIPWPVRESRIVPVGHLIELCADCRLGRTRCTCPTEFGTKGASDTTIWIPMLYKTQICGMCAGIYDGMVIRPRQFPHTPYLHTSGASVARAKPKPVPSQDVRDFYGDTFRSRE